MSRADRRRKERAEAKRKKSRKQGFFSDRVTRIVALVTLIVIVAGVGGWGVWSLAIEPVGDDTVLKVVNGREITERELVRRVNVLRYLYDLPAESIDAAIREQLLEDLVDEDLIAAEAARRGLEVTQEEFDGLAEEYEASLRLAYKTALKMTAQRLRLRVSAADIEDFLRSSILRSKLYHDVTAEVSVTEEDIIALYEESKEELEKAGLSLEDVKDTLAADALQRKRGEVYNAFIEALRAEADISTPG